MPCIANIWGTGVNPINVSTIELADEEREVRRDGAVISKSIIKVVRIHMNNGEIKTFSAASDDPVAQANLLQGVIIGLNKAWNSKE